MTCTHGTFEFSPKIDIIETPEPFTTVAVNVRCADCHELFHWRGLNSGHPNPNVPTVSADAYTLFAPISAGPGAIVGLLEKTGLGDRLVDPNGLSAPEASAPRL